MSVTIITYLEGQIQKVGEEIRTTKDRVRLAELGAVRAWLKNAQSEAFDEVEGEEE